MDVATTRRGRHGRGIARIATGSVGQLHRLRPVVEQPVIALPRALLVPFAVDVGHRTFGRGEGGVVEAAVDGRLSMSVWYQGGEGSARTAANVRSIKEVL